MELKILNLPTKEIYKDLFQPGMKKAGEALSTVLDVSNLILLPLKLLNEKSKIYLEINLKSYSNKMNNKELTATQVPQYIGLPILEKLTYLEQNELSEAFLNLLTKASFVESSNLAHPAFITILNNLSVDEAKILFHYNNKDRIPYIDIYIHRYKEKLAAPINEGNKKVKSLTEIEYMIEYTFQDREDAYLKYENNLTGIEKEIELLFPENIDIYIENLLHNGLIYLEKELIHKDDIPRYDFLKEEAYKQTYHDLEKLLAEVLAEGEYIVKTDTRRCNIQFTELGKSFLKACIKE